MLSTSGRSSSAPDIEKLGTYPEGALGKQSTGCYRLCRLNRALPARNIEHIVCQQRNILHRGEVRAIELFGASTSFARVYGSHNWAAYGSDVSDHIRQGTSIRDHLENYLLWMVKFSLCCLG